MFIARRPSELQLVLGRAGDDLVGRLAGHDDDPLLLDSRSSTLDGQRRRCRSGALTTSSRRTKREGNKTTSVICHLRKKRELPRRGEREREAQPTIQSEGTMRLGIQTKKTKTRVIKLVLIVEGKKPTSDRRRRKEKRSKLFVRLH